METTASNSGPAFLPTVGGGRLMPGINLDKTSELLGLLDDERWFSTYRGRTSEIALDEPRP